MVYLGSLLACHQLDNIPLLGIPCQCNPSVDEETYDVYVPSSLARALLSILFKQHGRSVVLINC